MTIRDGLYELNHDALAYMQILWNNSGDVIKLPRKVVMFGSFYDTQTFYNLVVLSNVGEGVDSTLILYQLWNLYICI